ncbi:MAG: N-acetyl-gamma-glutamyl-phosphate reductase [Eubacteriales bacterium]
MKKTKVGIIGATGYVGVELIRILSMHPNVILTHLVSQSFVGKSFSDVYPSFRGICDLPLTGEGPEAVAAGCDLVITALPHGISSKVVPVLLSEGVKVIDHSGDFRYRRQAVYEASYGLIHPCPELLPQAVYGIPELYRDKLATASLVANPGCYPTCSILGLAPLLAKKIINTGGIIVDAVSGISGAGRKAELAYSYCESSDNFKAYSVSMHRHTTEIEQEYSILAGVDVCITFTPHLAPMKRGMYATIYADLLPETRDMTASEIRGLYETYYSDDSFVRILPLDVAPETRYVAYSNYIDISIFTDPRTGKVKILSAQDNLGKGAAAQAVQALNAMQGYPEGLGLSNLCGCL